MNGYKPYLGQNKHNWLDFETSEEFWDIPDVKAIASRPGFIRITQIPRKYYDNGWKRYNELHAEYKGEHSVYFGFTIDPVDEFAYLSRP